MARATLVLWEMRPPLWVRNMEVPLYTLSVVICDCWTQWGHIFGPPCCFMLTRKASTMRSSARSLNPAMVHGVTKAVDKRPRYLRCLFLEVILYWLRYVGNGSVSVVQSWEVSASQRFEVSCPLYRGCPLFRGSVIRGFTVMHFESALCCFKDWATTSLLTS